MTERVRALSSRERECLTLLRDLTRKEIADQLHIGQTSVATHLMRAARKLGAKHGVQAAFTFIRFEFEQDREYASWGKS